MPDHQLFNRSEPVIAKRGVHLDLKGLPPTPQRLVELLHVFAAARLNFVLVEWEDAFPWTCDERFRSRTAYTSDDVARFVETAAELEIEIIPLVQCLGHMETPLSVPGNEHLQEMPGNQSTLNPLAGGARELIQEMVDDVLRLMPNVRHFHLGGDESWTFGQASDTKAYVQTHGKGALYLHHVEPILDSLNARGIRPILWHDMMIDWDDDALLALGAKCDLMAWRYAELLPEFLKAVQRFDRLGIPMWGAGAYKGAERNRWRHTSDLPVIADREANALVWIGLAKQHDLEGVVATAWSRWAVDTVQCVPIDAALDAMFLVASILHDGQPPPGGNDACTRSLAACGELESFKACRDSMQRLTDVRKRGWTHVMYARQQIVLAQRDARRISASNPLLGMKPVRQLAAIVEEADRVVGEVRQAFAGLIPETWVEEYLATRVEPLREELHEIDVKARSVIIAQ